MKFTETITRHLVRFLVAVAALALLAATDAAQAATFTWNVPTGSFQDAASWTPSGGPPAAPDIAQFTGPGNQLVTFNSDWTVGGVTVGDVINSSTSSINFDLNGHTLANIVTFGNTANATSLTLTDGILLTPGNTGFGSVTNANFTLTLDHATFASTGATNLATGSGSVVNLMIRNGSSYSAAGSNVGSGGTGTVTVDGVGSLFSLGTTSLIGSTGSGTINVQNGASLRTTGPLQLAFFTNNTGAVSLTGAGSSWTQTDGFITTGSGTAATMTVNAGTMMTVTGTSVAAGITLGNHATLTDAGSVNVSGVGNSGITVNSGGTLTVNALGSITTQNLTRSGTGVINVNDGTLAINGGTFDNGGAQLNLLSGGSFQLQSGGIATGVTELNVSSTSPTGQTIKVLSGDTFKASSIISIGGTSGTGAAVVDGAGSVLTTSLNTGFGLILGGNAGGIGTLIVQNGGRYFQDPGAAALLGSNQGAGGTITVTGAGSRFDVGNLHIGAAGAGTFNITAGGVATSAQATLAEPNGSIGSATVAGAGSTWTTINGLYVGGTSTAAGGAGSLTIANGGAVTVAGGQTKIWNTGTLTINGGSLTTGDFTRLGALNLQNGTLTVDGGQFDNGSQFADLAIQGNAANTLATLQFSNGSYTKSLTVGNLSVGNSRPGALILASGSSAAAEFGVSMATLPGGNSTIALSGGNTELDSIGAITVGGGGSATLTIGAGSTVNDFDALILNASGTVNLNGGTLTMNQFSPNGGAFNWTSGKVLYDGDAIVDGSQLAALLGTSGMLASGHTLGNTSGTMALTGNLTVAGGQLNSVGLTNYATLSVSSGSVQATTLANNGFMVISGGSLTATALSNTGEIQLASPAASVGSAGTTLTNSGRLDGTGRINSDLLNNANGVVAVDAGQRLVFGGSSNSNNNNGTISLTGGTVEFTAPLINAAGGFISGRGTFRGNSSNSMVGFPSNPVVDYGLKNSGVVAFSGGFSDVFGKVNNLISSSGGGGQIINAGGGIVTFHDDVVNNGTEIRTVAGSRTVFFGAVSGAAPFTGTGTVEFNGDLRPGNSPASVSFGGNLELGYSSKLQIELGGTIVGSQYDKVNVTGQLNLGGTLDVVLYNGFKPVMGNSFDILNWTSLSGMFSSENLPTMNGRIVWDGSQLYTTGTLSVLNTFYAGDFNRDGHVDAADIVSAEQALTDLSNYKSAMGMTDPTLFGLVADVNGDGYFNNADLQQLLINLKNGGSSADAVPEPDACLLAAIGLCCVAATRRLADRRAGNSSRR